MAKVTGIIRRIDDLGRIVIPKEIRHSWKIREGDPIELCLTDNGLLLKKYSLVGTINRTVAESCINALRGIGLTSVAICDRDNVVSGANINNLSARFGVPDEGIKKAAEYRQRGVDVTDFGWWYRILFSNEEIVGYIIGLTEEIGGSPAHIAVIQAVANVLEGCLSE